MLFIGFSGKLILFMAGFFILPFVLGCGAAWAVASTRPAAARRKSRLLAWSLVLALVALPVSMVATEWPMWIAFLASRPALDRLADRIAASEVFNRPEWAGAYRVVGADRDPANGDIRLTIDAGSSGNTRFVRVQSPTSTPGSRPQIVSLYPLSVDGRWWYEEED